MARPHKYTANYHTHDANMRNDDKILMIRNKFGNEGYAVYNMMLEVLDNSEHFRREWNENSIQRLAVDFRVTAEYLKEFIDYCISPIVNLFQIHNGEIYSEQHLKRHSSLLIRRESKRTTGTEPIAKSISKTYGNNSIEAYEQERQVIYNELPEDFKKALEIKTGIVRPMLWANKRMPQQYFDLIECIINVREDIEWRTRTQRDLNLDKRQFLDYLYSFINEIIRTMEYRGYDGYNAEDGDNNFIKHFSFWLKKKVKA